MEGLKKDLVTFNDAQILKYLGFNEECYAYYYKHGNSKKEKLFFYPLSDEYDIDEHLYLEPNSKNNWDAPTYSQAFLFLTKYMYDKQITWIDRNTLTLTQTGYVLFTEHGDYIDEYSKIVEEMYYRIETKRISDNAKKL